MNKNKALIIVICLLNFTMKLSAMFTAKLSPSVAQKLSKKDKGRAQKIFVEAEKKAEVEGGGCYRKDVVELFIEKFARLAMIKMGVR